MEAKREDKVYKSKKKIQRQSNSKETKKRKKEMKYFLQFIQPMNQLIYLLIDLSCHSAIRFVDGDWTCRFDTFGANAEDAHESRWCLAIST